ncbi:hypothetical protein ACTG2C_22070 [Aeromonas veronii]
MEKYYLCVLAKEPTFIIRDEENQEIFPEYKFGIIEYLKSKRINPYSIIKSYEYRFQSARTDSEFSACEIYLHYCGAVSIEIPEEKQENINSSAWFYEPWVSDAYRIIKGFLINILNILPTESLRSPGYCEDSLVIHRDENEYKRTSYLSGSQLNARFINACDIYVNSPADDNSFIHLAYQFSFTRYVLLSDADISHKEYNELIDATHSFFIPLNINLAITYGTMGVSHTFIFYAWKAIEELAKSIYAKHIQEPVPHKINITLNKLKNKNIISQILFEHLDKIRVHRNALIHDPSISFMLISEKIQTETHDIIIYTHELIDILKKDHASFITEPNDDSHQDL